MSPNPDLFTAARHGSVPTPAGGSLRIWTRGRSWFDVVLDRPLHNPWPQPAGDALHRLSEHLSWFCALHSRRGVAYGGFETTGILQAPKACARDLLAVVLSADFGDATEVNAVLAIVERLVAQVMRASTYAGRRAGAAYAVSTLAGALYSRRYHRMATPSDPLSQAILEAVNRVGHRPRPIPPDLAARLLADDGRAVPVTWRRFDYDDDGMPAGVHVEDFTATVAVTRESLGLPPEDGDEA